MDKPQNKAQIGKEIIQKVGKKLQGSKSKIPSQVSKLVLCMTVLQSTLTHHLLTTKIF